MGDTIKALTETVRGRVITASDPDYDDARAVDNAIARCSGTADVVAAVGFVREHDVEIAVRGGGHNVAGTAVCDGVVVIDLSATTCGPRQGLLQLQHALPVRVRVAVKHWLRRPATLAERARSRPGT